MTTIDQLLNTILTPFLGPRCPWCWARPGRGTFLQLAHEVIDHADERPVT